MPLTSGVGVRVRVRLGIGLGLGLANPNPNPNPNLGSLIFFLGALIDLLVVLRAAAAERGSRHRAQITQETTEMTAPDLTESELTERQSEAPAAVGTLSRVDERVEAAVSRHRMLVEEHRSHDL